MKKYYLSTISFHQREQNKFLYVLLLFYCIYIWIVVLFYRIVISLSTLDKIQVITEKQATGHYGVSLSFFLRKAKVQIIEDWNDRRQLQKIISTAESNSY